MKKSISIINPNKGPEVITGESTDADVVQFFPEGGNLVYNLNNTIAYKITDAFGKGLQATGVIVSEKNDTVAKFEHRTIWNGHFFFYSVERKINITQ